MGCEDEVIIIRECQNLQERAVKLTSNPARIFPKCPACGLMEENLEAIRTEKFFNPLQRHPQQMTCGSCSTEYCTDCLLYGARFNEVHQGRICRGSADDSRLPFPNSRTCPICDYMTDKIDGCSFITCDKCLSHWCYPCRVPRDVEMGRNIHRCLILPSPTYSSF